MLAAYKAEEQKLKELVLKEQAEMQNLSKAKAE